MKIEITYEQALEKASPWLREKMKHSVELIRKSEALALKYDPEKGFAVGFSGGKDSQAVYHMMQLAGVRFWAQFSPTSVDPPEVIRFIKQEYPEVKFRKLTTSIFRKAVEIGCLPTMRIRWCCAEFKENAFPNKVTVVGVRKSESVKRSKRNEVEVSGHKFSGDFDEFEQWQDKKIEKIKKKYKNLNQDQFAEQQNESTIRCVGGKDSIIILPILDWSDHDVWEFLNDVIEVPHCSLYDEGRYRIGCIMCPFAGAKNTNADIKRWPHVYWKWVDVVRQLREDRPTTGGGDLETRRQLYPPPTDYEQWYKLLVEQGGYSKPNGKYTRPNYYRKQIQACQDTIGQAVSRQDGGDMAGAPFLPSPTGEGYINTPEEMIIHWWISKLSFKDWYAKYIQQQTLDFDD